MSIYATLDGEIGDQVASNRGWSDALDWIDGLDADRFPEPIRLVDYGWSQELPELKQQLESALEESPPDKDTASVMQSLISMLNGTEAEVLTLTDGLAPSTEEDDLPSVDEDKAAAHGVVAAGLALQALDTGRVLMLQRALDDGDPNGGKWEIPGGHIDGDQEPFDAAQREWEEEVGLLLPSSTGRGQVDLVGYWESSNGKYVGYIETIPTESAMDLTARDASANPDGDRFEAVAWVDPADFENHNLRPELLTDLPAVRAALEIALAKRRGADYYSGNGDAAVETKRLELSQLPNGEWNLEEDGLSVGGPYPDRQTAQMEMEQRIAKEREKEEADRDRLVGKARRIGKSATGGQLWRIG